MIQKVKNFFNKKTTTPETVTQTKKHPFSIAGKTVYYLTNDRDRFEDMQSFFKQFDLKNTQTWKSTEHELQSFMTLKATWKYEEEKAPYVGSMEEETLKFYKEFLLKYKADFYIVDQNLDSLTTTGQSIIQCVSYAQHHVQTKENNYPLAVYLYSEGDEVLRLHKALRYVMIPEHASVDSITPELYKMACELMRSVENPTWAQKVLNSV